LKDSTKFGRGAGWRAKQNESFSAAVSSEVVLSRNARSVWTIPTEGFKGAHFATFPREIPRRCILAGSRPGDVVFDPFMGSGTVAEVALSLGRRFIGTELNPESAAMFERYRSQQRGLPV
jgi:DNA modification methylase